MVLNMIYESLYAEVSLFPHISIFFRKKDFLSYRGNIEFQKAYFSKHCYKDGYRDKGIPIQTNDKNAALSTM